MQVLAHCERLVDILVTEFGYFQIVLLKDRKRGFGIEDTKYEPQAVSVHPGGVTVAIGGSVSE